ncbi:hypothetical protein [Providencia rettgeri]|uniref:Lipoprotein n=1 Tax=Providencia rettgeri TaxID=587 RepID=A0A379LQD7_PRORE|nr:hypothetical protein [Providencia rettgeri]SUC32102.1 Uncharacterised protein [Providencia rettgeri]SUD99056.1 Uncharacterised protein [Providencia rettgeri]SUD99112.1 Uncharacterised protein [Providencia rettgeri]
MKKRLAFVAFASLALAACSSVPQKKVTSTISKPNAPKTATVSTNNETNLAATAYGQNKQLRSQGIVIASTRNACVDSFNFLKGLNQGQFDNYSADYSKINQNYTFLNINKEIMDKDSKELLSMTLNKKLDTLCAKVQYAGFIGVKDRLKALSDI